MKQVLIRIVNGGIVFFFLFFICNPGIGAENTLIVNGGYYFGTNNNPLLQSRQNDLFIPASTIKILTALAAIKILGPQYRFVTKFYLDDKDNLTIKGYGDPFLISEKIFLICQQLHEAGLRHVASISIDGSSFQLNSIQKSHGSLRPYDAPNGATTVNFNSVPIHITKQGKIHSSEEQTPNLSLMHDLPQKLPEGTHRLNISAWPDTPLLSPEHRYVAELFSAHLQAVGVSVNKQFFSKIVQDNHSLFLSYTSQLSLTEILQKCLHFSNNFVANQIYLAIGAKVYGFPATWSKSQLAITEFFMNSLNLDTKDLKISDGAGLSLKNRISPSALGLVLENFLPYKHLLPKENSTFIKSGTLRGVYCYGGYWQNTQGYTPFAILLNQKRNTRDSVLRHLIKKQQHLSNTH